MNNNKNVLLNSGFFRVATVCPILKLAHPNENVNLILKEWKKAEAKGAEIVLFPELAVTGYTCADWFFQQQLKDETELAIKKLIRISNSLSGILIVGAPIHWKDRLYNSALVICKGELLGVVPKQHLPNNNEFYEKRWFVSGKNIKNSSVLIGDKKVPFGTDILFQLNCNELLFGIEICEDLWSPNPPSVDMCVAGAELILNLSASNEVLGKAVYRKNLVNQQSARCLSAYAYSSSGPFESSTDLVFSGHCIIAENGHQLVESERFSFKSSITIADIDLQYIRHERSQSSAFSDSIPDDYHTIEISNKIDSPKKTAKPPGYLRDNSRFPFVPSEEKLRSATCEEIINIQTTGLIRRMLHLKDAPLIVGVSGGLDSTLALLIAVKACDKLKRSRKDVIGVTMPGNGTTNRTRQNAEGLINKLKAKLKVISISESVKQHLKDIDHDPKKYDVTYENAQARERTQILMDLSNQNGGFVIGTGDLSEAALGWCTFNGDHMSMYHINIGVPKTLIQYLIKWIAEQEGSKSIKEILQHILETPITPELLPLSPNGKQIQETESIIGPYELHDYFLFHTVRKGSSPEKILYLAERAFDGSYHPNQIKKWLELFIKRFISQQFKRSVMPDGPKVGSVSLSPRGDWRMPSDIKV